LNSNIRQNWIGEFNFGLHFQQNNLIPASAVASTALVTDNFGILRSNGTIAPVTNTGFNLNGTGTAQQIADNAALNRGRTGFVDYIFAPGGTLQRNFVQQGFGLFQNQSRDRLEFSARFQNIWAQQTIKYGFEFYRNKYDINQTSTGPNQTFNNPFGLNVPSGNNNLSGFRVTNNFSVCTTRTINGAGTVVCPNATAVTVFNALPTNLRPAGFTANALATIAAGGTQPELSSTEALNNPFLVRLTTVFAISN